MISAFAVSSSLFTNSFIFGEHAHLAGGLITFNINHRQLLPSLLTCRHAYLFMLPIITVMSRSFTSNCQSYLSLVCHSWILYLYSDFSSRPIIHTNLLCNPLSDGRHISKCTLFKHHIRNVSVIFFNGLTRRFAPLIYISQHYCSD
jgi:hypothetical protein